MMLLHGMMIERSGMIYRIYRNAAGLWNLYKDLDLYITGISEDELAGMLAIL